MVADEIANSVQVRNERASASIIKHPSKHPHLSAHVSFSPFRPAYVDFAESGIEYKL